MAASKRAPRKAPAAVRDNAVVHGAGGTRPARARRATTLRLEPALLSGLKLLQQIEKQPLNRMINDALRSYVARRSAEIEGGLQDILDRVRAYRRTDPDFEKMWVEFVNAEARYGAADPVEGSLRKNAGPAQTLVRNLIRA